jgi:hypothetical protein
MYNVVLLQIMYLAEENWRKRGVHADVSFYTGGPAIFASPYYGKVLTRVSSPHRQIPIIPRLRFRQKIEG